MPSRPPQEHTDCQAPTRVRLTAFGGTDKGKRRGHNEDAFLCEAGRGVLLVADGMGGLAHGEVASQEVVSGVSRALSRGDRLVTGLETAHAVLLRMTSESRRGESMGSTAVAVSWNAGEPSVSVTWIGDSRAYLWRDGALEQLTRDHSLVQDLLDMQLITAADAERHPNRNVITRALGVHAEQALQIDSVQIAVQPGDRLLLCSDGLSGFLPEQRVCGVLSEGADDPLTVERLIRLTLDETAAGDNVTVICASVLRLIDAPATSAEPV
ncbi:MAG: PP2C family protein-serine/threonine phosphatase [Panacagrimonas sp.]